MKTDLDTLLTALYVKIDDELKGQPRQGCPPRFTDAELVTVAVAQVLLGHDSERHWIRAARKQIGHLFPYLPNQPGYNKRLRAALPLIQRMIRLLAFDTDFWFDDHWLLDSTPVPCGASRPTVQRSDLAGWAAYGYCASHSRYFWGLRATTRSVNAIECFRELGPRRHLSKVGPLQGTQKRMNDPRLGSNWQQRLPRERAILTSAEHQVDAA